MPFIVPFIPLIAAGLTTGVGLFEGSKKPSLPAAIDPSKQPLTAAQNRQQTAAVASELPNLQSLTGGSLSPEYASQFGALSSGLANDPRAAGNIQAAINQFFGLAAPGETGFSKSETGAGGAGILDILKGVSVPGSAPKPPTTVGGSDFVNEALNSDTFKGLVA